MRIAVDVSDLATGRADGTTRYTYEVVKRMVKLGSEHEWLGLAPTELKKDFKIESKNFELVTSRWLKFWTQSRLPIDIYRYRPDVLFMPIQQLPLLRPKKMKTVAVIHDLACHDYGEQFTWKDWALLHIFSAQVANQADQIIAVSKATALDIKKFYSRDLGIRVIHHGVDQARFQVKKVESKSPYILYVGQLQPRKNLVRLIEAFEKLKNENLELKIVGSHGWLKKEILEKIRTSSKRDKIRLCGRVDDNELVALYAGAEVFVLPSLYEGFGLPVIEAMACGTPVVTSNLSCLPEIAGGAAILVDPYNVNEIASGIELAMKKSYELSSKGRRRAADFSWDKTASETLDVLLN